MTDTVLSDGRPIVEQRETRAAADSQPEHSKFWLQELEAAGKRDEHWIKRARVVVKRYRDEREFDNAAREERRTNILWSNTDLLKSALFQGIGSPDVRRRFPKRGQDEKVTKQAALVMERSASYINDSYDCEGQIAAAVEDMVLPGRGQCWVVYDAEVGVNPETGTEEIMSQTVRDEHVYWEDYRTSSGRKETDIWWKARCHYYSRDELREYFPDHADRVPLTAQLVDTTKDNSRDEDDTFKRSKVWEVWDKTKKQRVWVAEGYELVLKKEEDPYKLQGFFPCPEALYGVKTTSTLVPIPEFTLYQDQAAELDIIATRLCFLVEALKRRGVYDSSLEGADSQLSQLALAGDNQFVPYKGLAGLMEKGGLKAVFQTEDLAPLVTAIEGLYKRAAFLVQSIYEVTGISDVLRGSSNASETATAQQIKANFGSMRLKARQKMVQRFIRSLLRIKTEIIAEHFTREQLQEMVGLDMPLAAEQEQAKQQLAAMQQQAQMAQQSGQPPQIDPEAIKKLQEIANAPTWEEVSGILRSDARRAYKVDVETDQTAQVDEQQEKQDRIEFMSTIMAQMEKMLPVAMQFPAMRPLIKETVMFSVKAFRAGRPLEEAFDEAFTALEKLPPPQQQGDPVAQAKAEEIKAKTQATIQGAQIEAQTKQMDAQVKQQGAQLDFAAKVVDLQAKKAESQHKQELAKMQAALQMRREAHAFGREVEKAEMERAMDDANARLAAHSNEIEAASALEELEAKRAKRLGAF